MLRIKADPTELPANGISSSDITIELIDEDGNPIEKAKIVIEFLKNMQINRKTTTNKKGAWAIMGLGTGKWKVTASADGYVPAFVNIYVRQLERNPTITLTLKKIRQSDRSIVHEISIFTWRTTFYFQYSRNV